MSIQLAPEVIGRPARSHDGLPDVETAFGDESSSESEVHVKELESEPAPLPATRSYTPKATVAAPDPNVQLVASTLLHMCVVCAIAFCLVYVPPSLSVLATSGCSCASQQAAHFFPRWYEKHDTRSRQFSTDNVEDMGLIETLTRAFGEHTKAPCVCMHHLQIAQSTESRAVCASGSDDLMLNPIVVGESEDGRVVHEYSTQCGDTREQKRKNTVYVQWVDARTLQSHRARFDGAAAVCLQLAVEEIDGWKCVH